MKKDKTIIKADKVQSRQYPLQIAAVPDRIGSSNGNQELTLIGNDLTNLLTSASIPIVMLTNDLCIRRFTPQAGKVLKLLPGDVGRPIGDINSGIEVDNKTDSEVLVLLDIDAAKIAQLKLKTASEYADAIVQTIREPLLILTGDLRIKSANQSFYKTFKVTPEETENQLLYELGSGQWDQPALRKLLTEVLSTHSVFNDYEVEFQFPDLGRRVMLLNARRLLQEHDQTDLILLALEDITEWRAAEVVVQVSEQRYRRLFESAHDGILILDPDTGKIVDANPYIEELLGYSHVQLVGKELWEIGLLKDEVASQQAYRELQEQGYIRYEDLPLQTADGAKRDVEFVSNLYREGDHRVIQCNIRDITQRKQTEQALSESNRNKDTFLAMLGHELRNPLSGIISGLQALKQISSHDAETTELYDVIARQSEHVSRLVDDLLDISRISAGKIRLRRKRVNLVELVATVVSDHRHHVETSKLSMSSELPDSPIWIKGDLTKISQVVKNLLNNATKFTDAGGSIKVTVEARGETGHETAKIIVQDTGIGMVPSTVTTMFEPFRQADTSIARSRGGLGLGMALSKQLVELHGGSITVNSEGLGHGSTFTVNLPLSSDQTSAARPEITLSPRVLKKHRIVIVDDQRGLRLPMRHLLKSLGQDVVAEAENGINALAAVREFRPEIVMCDVGLPDMDGYAVAREIRTDTDLSATFLVAVTGYGQDDDRQLAHEAGFNLHLTKPIGHDDLRVAIEQFECR